MNFPDVTMKYDCLVVFIRQDSAEIMEFRYGLTLIIGNLKFMAGWYSKNYRCFGVLLAKKS